MNSPIRMGQTPSHTNGRQSRSCRLTPAAIKNHKPNPEIESNVGILRSALENRKHILDMLMAGNCNRLSAGLPVSDRNSPLRVVETSVCLAEWNLCHPNRINRNVHQGRNPFDRTFEGLQ